MLAFMRDSIRPPAGIQKYFDGIFSSVKVSQKFAVTLISRGVFAGFSIWNNKLSAFSSVSDSAEFSVKLRSILFSIGVLESIPRFFQYKRRIAPSQICDFSSIPHSLQILSKGGTSVEFPSIPINIIICQDIFSESGFIIALRSKGRLNSGYDKKALAA